MLQLASPIASNVETEREETFLGKGHDRVTVRRNGIVIGTVQEFTLKNEVFYLAIAPIVSTEHRSVDDAIEWLIGEAGVIAKSDRAA